MPETIAQQLAGHVPRMYRVALRIVGKSDAAQEVAQEACVKALRCAESFGGRAALTTWLHRITVNCAHDHLRNDRRAGPGPEQLRPRHAGHAGHARRRPGRTGRTKRDLSPGTDPGCQTARDCRSAFVLTQLDEYTYDEAAAIEDVARGTVASRVHRARQILIEQMNHHLLGPT